MQLHEILIFDGLSEYRANQHGEGRPQGVLAFHRGDGYGFVPLIEDLDTQSPDAG